MESTTFQDELTAELKNFEEIAKYLNPSPGEIPELEGVDIHGVSLPLRSVIGGDHILYIDFSSEFVAGHPGGATAEYHTVSAIMRTVSENFPEVAAVQLLVEGSQVGTIAGHVDAYGPLLVRDWR